MDNVYNSLILNLMILRMCFKQHTCLHVFVKMSQKGKNGNGKNNCLNNLGNVN